MATDEDRVQRALTGLIKEAGGVEALITPRGYPHLGLALVDATFSLRANYDTQVVPVLQRYCGVPGTVPLADRFT